MLGQRKLPLAGKLAHTAVRIAIGPRKQKWTMEEKEKKVNGIVFRNRFCRYPNGPLEINNVGAKTNVENQVHQCQASSSL